MCLVFPRIDKQQISMNERDAKPNNPIYANGMHHFINYFSMQIYGSWCKASEKEPLLHYSLRAFGNKERRFMNNNKNYFLSFYHFIGIKFIFFYYFRV
jgi:hypothetical protein